MFAKCSTCLEPLHPSQELTSGPCGHVLHYHCIIQWLNTGKNTCPQCRASCKESLLRRIYFSEGDELPKVDEGDLWLKIDSLTRTNNGLSKEIKRLKEDYDKVNAQAVGIREEFRDLERERNSLSSQIVDLKTQLRYNQVEHSKNEKLRTELKELKEELVLYQAVRVTLEGSVSEVNKKLHEIGDFSKTSRGLSILIVALKKELEADKTEIKELKRRLRDSAISIKELKSSAALQEKEIKNLTSVISTLTSDLKHSEEEKEIVKSKVNSLQDALDSPGDDPRKRALRRVASEFPVPKLIEDDYSAKTPSPLNLKTKSCCIVGLKRKSFERDEKNKNDYGAVIEEDYNILRKSRLGCRKGIFNDINTKSFNKMDEKFYNGLGGHDKLDTFPSASSNIHGINRVGVVPKKAPKGVSKPSKKLCKNNIDKYFNLDVP